MKIEVKKINNQYQFYDEVYGILSMYSKKLYHHPYKKIIPLTKSYLIYVIFCTMMLIYLLFILLTVTNSHIILICLGIVCMCLIIGIARLIQANKGIKKLVNRNIDTTIAFNKEKISLDNKIIGQKNELRWKDIKWIIIGKYSIGFMPTKESNSQLALFCSIDYKEQVNKAIEKYQHKDLWKEQTK